MLCMQVLQVIPVSAAEKNPPHVETHITSKQGRVQNVTEQLVYADITTYKIRSEETLKMCVYIYEPATTFLPHSHT